MTDAAEQKALDYLQQAAKKANSSSGFFGRLLNDPSSVAEQSAELYRNAAIQFKIAKKYKESGDAYIQAAAQFQKADQPHEAATVYTDAATAFKKDSVEECIRCTELAAQTYMDMGRFSMAGRQYKNLGELYEKKAVDIDKAIDAYKMAIDAFEAEDSQSSADKLRQSVADLLSQQEQYDEAITMYEEVASRMTENKLLMYGAKEYYLKAGITRLCTGDAIAAKRAAERYESEFPQFGGTREQKLLQAIIEAKEEDDAEKFTDALFEFDQIQKLTGWHTTLLLRVKASFGASEDVL